MAKFQGVISTRYQHPSEDLVLEFSDLDLLANYLFNETQNLFYEFQRKSEVFTEQEINLCQNLQKIAELDRIVRSMSEKSLKLDYDLEDVGFYLMHMEQSVDGINRIPANFVTCKCTPNLERSVTLEKLVGLSENFIKIHQQIELIKDEINWKVFNPCDLLKNFFLFLDYHTKILENIEQKADKITDQLQEIDGLFMKIHSR